MSDLESMSSVGQERSSAPDNQPSESLVAETIHVWSQLASRPVGPQEARRIVLGFASLFDVVFSREGATP
jgi:hypothetical protein